MRRISDLQAVKAGTSTPSGDPSTYGGVESVRRKLLNTDPAGLSHAGDAHISAAYTVENTASLLESVARSMAADWKDASSKEAQQALQLLHASARELAYRSREVGAAQKDYADKLNAARADLPDSGSVSFNDDWWGWTSADAGLWNPHADWSSENDKAVAKLVALNEQIVTVYNTLPEEIRTTLPDPGGAATPALTNASYTGGEPFSGLPGSGNGFDGAGLPGTSNGSGFPGTSGFPGGTAGSGTELPGSGSLGDGSGPPGGGTELPGEGTGNGAGAGNGAGTGPGGTNPGGIGTNLPNGNNPGTGTGTGPNGTNPGLNLPDRNTNLAGLDPANGLNNPSLTNPNTTGLNTPTGLNGLTNPNTTGLNTPHGSQRDLRAGRSAGQQLPARHRRDGLRGPGRRVVVRQRRGRWRTGPAGPGRRRSRCRRHGHAVHAPHGRRRPGRREPGARVVQLADRG